MAIITTDSKNYTDIAAAIRSKNGLATQYKPSEMAAAISAIVAGGGGGDQSQIPTDEELTITGNCSYRFAYNGWNWFINKYRDRITTKDITNTNHMFSDSLLTEIPFEINLSDSCSDMENMFYDCYELKKIRRINISTLPKACSMRFLFSYCSNLRELPEGLENINWDNFHLGSSLHGYMFTGCYSLRSVPKNFLKNIYNKTTNQYNVLYTGGFHSCHVLDELDGIPVEQGTFTSNIFNNMVYQDYRLKNLIFDINDDGSVKAANWKNQIIDLGSYIGYVMLKSNILNYNSGITADKEVKDDTSYQALKDDPDWFTLNIAYSRYNHDSAVRTINSLPNTSEYLAANGGTNTIKFNGNSGAKTDGGAINTLTEEEIAVATAKGWTVTLV